MKLSAFGGCKTVLLFPKANKGAVAVVVTLFDVLLFAPLLKPAILTVVVVLAGNNVFPMEWDGKLDTTA